MQVGSRDSAAAPRIFRDLARISRDLAEYGPGAGWEDLIKGVNEAIRHFYTTVSLLTKTDAAANKFSVPGQEWPMY